MDGLLYQSQARTIMLFLGATGLGPSVTISKNGGSFASSVNTITEVANGWYSLLLDAGETDTVGMLAIHTSAGTPSDFLFQVGAIVGADVVGWRGQVPDALVTNKVPAVVGSLAADTIDAASIKNDAISKIFQGVALTESYAADGAIGTPAQLLYALLSALSEFSISGVTLTCKKLDGSTPAMTFTLNSATAPTSRTRSA